MVEDGDDVLLYLDRKRKYLIRVRKDEVFHTHKGYLNLNDLVGKSFGTVISSSMDTKFVALKPTIADYLQKIERRTQIMYPKDMALLLVYSNIGSGSVVVEAGTGSGALTSLLAFYVKPDGKVYSYETRPEFIEVAERNLKRLGLYELVVLRRGDVTLGMEESNVNAVVLDMATPWLAVKPAHKALEGGGTLASFSPTIDQTVKTVEVMGDVGFTGIETVECITRRYQVEAGRTRPETLMIAHTGYLTFGRKYSKAV